ncbi:DUF192 domain-containing protein [Maricaulis salignorans]|uniref:Uncharacterized ACR, COG1430 n=1 Tax=Maricaulis salignorans TaxID=144026 RepID=A0A1G9P8Q7_9PROT|nr:DUF192 domain-containing protein [Maricaulis salignorans]SDL94871.1 Uncharacterized ACR, COG1430 [Maricaulis salignorans]
MKNLILISALIFAAPAWAQDDTVPAEMADAAQSTTMSDTGSEAGLALPPIEFGGPEALTIDTGETQHVFMAEIATTPEQMARGLMGREQLDPDAAMLFVYMPPRRASMWMEDTLISLDLLFIREDGVVVKLIANAQPGSHRSLGSDFDVAAVLEIAGGRAAELGIRPGAILRDESFGSLAVETAAVEPLETTLEDTSAAPESPSEAQ